MSATEASTMVSGIDLMSIPPGDFDADVALSGDTVRLVRSPSSRPRTVTLSAIDRERIGVHVDDAAVVRATLEARGPRRVVRRGRLRHRNVPRGVLR
jgi:hypothetical protein